MSVAETLAHSRTAKAPRALRIGISSTLTGIVVNIGAGPNDNDPLGQRSRELVYGDLPSALAELGGQVAGHVAALAEGIGE